MGVQSSENTITRQARFALAHQIPIVVVVQDERGLPAATTKGWLLDISQNGARLAVESEIPLSGALRIRLTLTELGMEFYVGGSVCWTHPDPDTPGSWRIGCSLTPGIPERLLSRLAQTGVVERRFEARSDEIVSVQATIRGGRTIAAGLQNYSRKGFCLQTTEVLTPGEIVHLRIQGPDGRLAAIQGVVQWTAAHKGSHLAGCTLSGNP